MHPMPDPISRDRALGALLGAAVGDALGQPVDGLSHQNVRTYYRGIKGFTADTQRGDLAAGQWTIHTQRTFAYARTLAKFAPTLDFLDDDEDGTRGWDWEIEDGLFLELALGPPLRRPRADDRINTADAAACAAAFGVWGAARGADAEQIAHLTHGVIWGEFIHQAAITAAIGQAHALALALAAPLPPLNGGALGGAYDAARFIGGVVESTFHSETIDGPNEETPISDRLRTLALHLDEFPLDLQDRCNGTGDKPDEAFPFAVAMAARGPDLVEATLLSAVNVGGAASPIGAMTGALLGAFNGWSAFPDAWRDGLEDMLELRIQAEQFLDALGVD